MIKTRRPPRVKRVLTRSAAKLAPFDASDSNRRMLKDFMRHETMAARYEVSAAGHLYRDDGRLVIPDTNLRAHLNGNKTDRSLPNLVYLAFGRVRPPTDKYFKWRPWVSPDTPIDPLTDRRRCSVHNVVLVPHSELIRMGQGKLKEPATRLKIV